MYDIYNIVVKLINTVRLTLSLIVAHIVGVWVLGAIALDIGVFVEPPRAGELRQLISHVDTSVWQEQNKCAR